VTCYRSLSLAASSTSRTQCVTVDACCTRRASHM